MKSDDLLKLFKKFEIEISSFRAKPSSYDYKLKNYQLRAFSNVLPSFLFWFFIVSLFNIFAFYFFINSTNSTEWASLISVTSLFLTIFSRSTSLNYFLYVIVSKLGKFYLLHQFINRIGLFHRLMATTTILWLFIFLYKKPFVSPYFDEGILLLLLIFLTFIIFTASSLYRRKKHNVFENVHRYVGYVSFILLTLYFFISSFDLGLNINEILVKPQFLVLFLIVSFLIGPWIGVKKVNPKLVHVAPHVIGLQLTDKPSYGTYSSFTLADGYFHPFGDSMIDFDDMNNRTLYITPAGDRTSKIVEEANKGNFLLDECTLKRDRKYGFMYYHGVYDYIMIVVTGGGIAPIIPCLVLNEKTKIIVIWICHSPEKEFSPKLLGKLIDKTSEKDIHLHIINTDDKDVKDFTNEVYADLVLKACNHYKPESVFVMSNQKFTINMMNALGENNIKSYGANFDS